MAKIGWCVCEIQKILLTAKLDIDPSVKLIIVVPDTHGSNGRSGIAMLYLVAGPGPFDGPAGCMIPSEDGQIWIVSFYFFSIN